VEGPSPNSTKTNTLQPPNSTPPPTHTHTHTPRYGAPVEGLRPGSLLVAGEGLDGSLFGRSVVLVTDVGRYGYRGVVLTQVSGWEGSGALLRGGRCWGCDA